MSTDAEAELEGEVVEPVEDSGFTPLSDEQMTALLNEGNEVHDLPDSASEPGDAAGDVEPASNEAEATDLESLRRTAEELGWSTDDLSDFESADELRWFVRNFDKRNKVEVPEETEEVPAPKNTAKTPETPAETPVIPGFEWSLDVKAMEESGDYTDQEIALAKHVKAVYEQTAIVSKKLEEAKLAELGGSLKQFEEWKQKAEEQYQQQEAAAFSNAFHDIVDTLEESRFGRSLDAKGNVVKLPDDASANRVKLLEEIELQKLRHLRRGEPVPALSVLAKRAENNLFFDDIINSTRKKVTTKLSSQSRRRQLTPSRSKVPLSEPDDADDVANSPELRKAWEESGMADFVRK
jgi:hypothetical protein